MFQVLKQPVFIFADNKKTKRLMSLRLRCFHNGIILIVNCFNIVLQIYMFFE